MRGLDIGEFSQAELLCAPVADATIVAVSLACCRNRAARATLVLRLGNPVRRSLLSHRAQARQRWMGVSPAFAVFFVACKRSLGSINRYRLARLPRSIVNGAKGYSKFIRIRH